MKNKTFIYILIIALLLGAGAYMWLWPFSVSPNMVGDEMEEKNEEEKESNWKVYGNQDLGFEFKYPADWEVREGETITKFYSPEEIDVLNRPGTTDAPLGLSLRVFANDDELNLQEWLQERYNVESLDVSAFDPEANPRVFGINSIDSLTISNKEVYLVKEQGIGDSIIQTYYKGNKNIVIMFYIVGQSDTTISVGQEIIKTISFYN